MSPQIACGAPSRTDQSPAGIYIWQDCGAETWHLLATAGGDSGPIVYEGHLRFSADPSTIGRVNLETSDEVDVSGSRIDFVLNVARTWIDGIDCSVADTADARVSISSPSGADVYVGRDAVRMSGTFDPRTLGSCGI